MKDLRREGLMGFCSSWCPVPPALLRQDMALWEMSESCQGIWPPDDVWIDNILKVHTKVIYLELGINFSIEKKYHKWWGGVQDTSLQFLYKTEI